MVFGSGYVLLAFLREGLVTRLHWLTESQLLDAIVVGQFTPGPVFTTATFIGYVLGGGVGAVVATVGIFLQGFILVALSGPLIPRLRKSSVASAALDGVNTASLALMAAVTWQLLLPDPGPCLKSNLDGRRKTRRPAIGCYLSLMARESGHFSEAARATAKALREEAGVARAQAEVARR